MANLVRNRRRSSLLAGELDDSECAEKNVLIRRRANIADLKKDDHDHENFDFDTSIIIEFHKNIDHNSLHWIIDKIRSKKTSGGAGLILRREPKQTRFVIYIDSCYLNKFDLGSSGNHGLILHVSASRLRYLELADELGIVKPTKSGKMWNISIAGLDDFFIDSKSFLFNHLWLMLMVSFRVHDNRRYSDTG